MPTEQIVIPSPQEMDRQFREREDNSVGRLMKKCVDRIHACYEKGELCVTVGLDGQGCTEAAINEVLRRLKAKGWEAKRDYGDQRDPCNEIKITSPHQKGDQ